MRIILTTAPIAAIVLLAGCADPRTKEADGKLLCDPESGEAYIVEHRIGVNSKVTPIPRADEVCI